MSYELQNVVKPAISHYEFREALSIQLAAKGLPAQTARKLVTLSVERPLCQYGIAHRRAHGLFTYWLSKIFLGCLLCDSGDPAAAIIMQPFQTWTGNTPLNVGTARFRAEFLPPTDLTRPSHIAGFTRGIRGGVCVCRGICQRF